jgi:hypothetical protein
MRWRDRSGISATALLSRSWITRSAAAMSPLSKAFKRSTGGSLPLSVFRTASAMLIRESSKGLAATLSLADI